MIFKDKFEEKTKIIKPEFDKLVELSWKNQSHFGDLLLIQINGFYDPETLKWNDDNPQHRKNPHVIGPNHEGHSERAHNSFIDKYRKSHVHSTLHSEYIKQFIMEVYDKEICDRNDSLIDKEETTIQLEMLIYLKFWEADMIIKKLYQLVRTLFGEPYDWYFKICDSNRSKNCVGTRQNIISKMINGRIKEKLPNLHEVIKETYNTQIRNSIAHSNYSFLGRNIHPNNNIPSDNFSNKRCFTFDEWIDMFHNTLVLHNEYIRMGNRINAHYAKIANLNNNLMEIQITEINGKSYPLMLEYRNNFKDWVFKQNN